MNDTLKYLLNNGKKTLLVLDQDGTITESRWNEKLHSRNIIDDWDRTGEHYMDMPVIPQTMELVKYAAERGIQCGVLTASNEVEMKGKRKALKERPEFAPFRENYLWVDETNPVPLKAAELTRLAGEYEQIVYVDDDQGKLYAMQSLTPENVWLFHISSVLI